MRFAFVVLLVINTLFSSAQVFRKYYDYRWRFTDITNARFYSLMKNTDSGWICSDYFMLENRPIQMAGKFEDSSRKIKNGMFYYFYQNGKVSSAGKYIHNKKEGLWVRFHENGMMYDSAVFQNGRLVGTNLRWCFNGSLSDSIVVQDDFITYVSWFDNGSLSSTGRTNTLNKPFGVWQYFHKNGQLASQEVYDINGVLTAKTYFDEAGKQTDTTNRDRRAQFPGGEKKWADYLFYDFRWPPNIKITNGDHAVVEFEFDVSEEGILSNPRIIVPFFKPFNDAILKWLKNSPKWEPAISHNRKVMSTVRRSINFIQSEQIGMY